MATIVSAIGATPTRAQEVERTTATIVSYIAGPNIYVDLGREDGLATGDTVRIAAEGNRRGLLRVVSASERKTVLTFTGATFPISRGDRVRLTYLPHDSPAGPTARISSDQSPARARSSIMTAGRPSSAARRNRRSPTVRGRFSVAYQTLASSTRPAADADEMDRSFSSPSARLRLTVRDLPGGLTLNTSAYASYRYTSYQEISPRFLPRLYKLSITKQFERAPGAIEVGRFYGRFENFSGYWDGILLHLGDDGFGGGVASGFQPDRANEAFASDLPKHMAYMHLSRGLGDGRYSTDLSFHSVRPRNGLFNHTFFGWRQGWRQGAMTLSSELQADRDPEHNEWVVTRLIGRVTVPAGALRLRVGYSQRRPYSIWRSTGVVSYRRDRIDGGLQLVLPGGMIGAGVISNRLEGDDPYLTYTSFFSVPRSAVLGLGFNGSGSYWSRDGFTAVSAGIGVVRNWHTVSPRLSYQYYRTDAPAGAAVTHAINFSANVRLSRRMGAYVQSRTQFGELLRSQAYNVGTWVSF